MKSAESSGCTIVRLGLIALGVGVFAYALTHESSAAPKDNAQPVKPAVAAPDWTMAERANPILQPAIKKAMLAKKQAANVRAPEIAAWTASKAPSWKGAAAGATQWAAGGGDPPPETDNCTLDNCQVPDLGGGIFSDVECIGFAGIAQRLAEDKLVEADEMLTDLCWWGGYFDNATNGDFLPAPADSFTVTVYADAGTVPGAVIGGPFAVTPVVKATGRFFSGGTRTEYEYTTAIPAVAVSFGTSIWIEVLNDLRGTGAVWLWETAPGNGIAAFAVDNALCTGVWGPYNPDSFGVALCTNLFKDVPPQCEKDLIITIGACDEPPFKVFGDTLGAGNDSSCRSSEDLIFTFNIVETGVYSFDMTTNIPDPCIWDGYMYLLAGPDPCLCEGIITTSDDCPGIGCFGLSCIGPINLDPGEYWIVVEGFGAADAGPVDLHVTSECKQPCIKDFEVLAPFSTPVRSTCGAGNDCDLRSTEEHSYTVTLPNDGLWTFSLCGSSFDTYLFVGDDCCGSSVGFNDDSCGLQSEITANLSAGLYWVTVEGFSGCGDYILTVDKTPCIKDFEVLAPGSWTGNTCGAIDDCDLTALGHGSDNEDHSYTITLPNDGEWTFSLCGSNYDTKIMVGDLCCGDSVGFNDDFCGLQSQVTATLTAGLYWVTVDGFSTQCGDYILTVDKLVPPETGACCTQFEEVKFEKLEVNLPIPDDDPTGVRSQIFLDPAAWPGLIDDVDIDLLVQHTWRSDLIVTLIRKDVAPPIEIVLANRPDGGSDNIGNPATLEKVFFDSDALELFDDVFGDDPIGNYRPTEDLSVLVGLPKAGTWSLTITDNAFLDTGVFINWSLHFNNVVKDCIDDVLEADCLELPNGVFHLGELCADIDCNELPCQKDEETIIGACDEPPIKVLGNTIGAGNDSNCRSSEDLIFSFVILETGIYSFDMTTNIPDPCIWDGYMYLLAGPDPCLCDGIIDTSDDCPGIGCFGLSCIGPINLDPGKYWIVVEGFGAADAGPVDLHVTSECKVARGGCCDGTTGTCTDDVPEADCQGDQEVWFQDTLCVNIVCEEHTGACCDASQPGGLCTSFLTESDCLASGAGGGGFKVYDIPAGVLIPDCTPGGVRHEFTVPDSGIITDLDIDLDISHTWIGDLCVTVEKKSGDGAGTSASVVLRVGADFLCDDGVCCGCSGDLVGGSVILMDDEAAGTIDDLVPPCPPIIPAGSYIPDEALSVFDGIDKEGLWSITVIDNACQDEGTLNAWSLHILNADPQISWFKDEDCIEDGGTVDCLEHTGSCCDGCTGICTDGVPQSLCVEPEFCQPTWVKDGDCLVDPCDEHTGACCDASQPGGDCQDGVLESQCNTGDPQITWTKDTLCADLVPPCVEHTGACCDSAQPGGDCQDGVPESQCNTADPQITWTKDTLCANLVPPCEEHIGACCDASQPGGDCQDGVPESNCNTADPQITWTKDTLCANLVPPCEEHIGACCDTVAGTCQDDVAESACQGPDDQWDKDTDCINVVCEPACLPPLVVSDISSRFIGIIPDPGNTGPVGLRVVNQCTGEVGHVTLVPGACVLNSDCATGLCTAGICDDLAWNDGGGVSWFVGKVEPGDPCDPANFLLAADWIGPNSMLLVTGSMIAPASQFEVYTVCDCTGPVEAGPATTTFCTYDYADTNGDGVLGFATDLSFIFDNIPAGGWLGVVPPTSEGYKLDVQGGWPGVPDQILGFATDLSAVFNAISAGAAWDDAPGTPVRACAAAGVPCP